MNIINISTKDKYKFSFSEKVLLTKLSKEVFRLEKIKYDMSLNVSVVDGKTIKKLNKENRGIDKITDVLSFPNIEFKKPSDFSKYITKDEIDVSIVDLNSKTIFLGDVVICYNKVISQSKEYGHSIKREFAFLFTHSLLHLLGYDHMTKKQEKMMFDKQKKVLSNLGIVR